MLLDTMVHTIWINGIYVCHSFWSMTLRIIIQLLAYIVLCLDKNTPRTVLWTGSIVAIHNQASVLLPIWIIVSSSITNAVTHSSFSGSDYLLKIELLLYPIRYSNVTSKVTGINHIIDEITSQAIRGNENTIDQVLKR
jgi:hypothetical protein